MPGKSPLFALDAWVYATLENDATLSAFIAGRAAAEMVLPGTAFPYAVWRDPAVRDVRRIGIGKPNRTIIEREIFVVEKFGPDLASWDVMQEYADALDDLISARPSPRVQDHVITGAVRLRPARRQEQEGETSILWLGGLYRFYVERRL
jgi:hypothetical protein